MPDSAVSLCEEGDYWVVVILGDKLKHSKRTSAVLWSLASVFGSGFILHCIAHPRKLTEQYPHRLV